MATRTTSASTEIEICRVRELSKAGRHGEALAAAKTIAVADPQDRDALYLIAANQRCLNRVPDALATLQRLEQLHPEFSLLYQERGHCYASLRDAPRAIDAFLRAVALNPALATSWEMLERLYRITGNVTNAALAAEHLSALKNLPAEVVRAESLFSDGDLSAAESILRGFTSGGGNHVEALRLLARIEQQRGALDEAEMLLEGAVKLAPNYRAARLDYVRVLLDAQKYPEALDAINLRLSHEPDDPDWVRLHAIASAGLGRHDQAIASYRRLLASSSASAELHVLLGHSLKALGQRNEAIDAYKAAAAIRPSFGDSYWSLANLKAYRFSQDEIAQMRAAEAASSANAVDRYHLCFALGKAYEDLQDFAESWRFYERGNALKCAESRYSPELIELNARMQIEVCTPQFFSARAGVGAPGADPIFVLGLPRSGSTLLEQILASHALVEGTQELYEIPRIARELQGPRADPEHPRYPSVLTELTAEEFLALGERYVLATRAYRSEKPHFIDKMPNNFRHIGLIHLILPNAKIIDMRREPIACCLSNLKQLFAAGQEFTYSADAIARYYRAYLELMRHWDAVLPRKILRVLYEDLVDDLELNVRRILDFCGLEFQAACVEFHKTQRSIRTPSSEQVRRPIFRDALDQWRNYEPWLDPLKQALGDAVTRYRE